MALTFSVGPVLAVPGVPDNQPGSDFTCFFSVSKARVTDGTGPTTLYNITDVRGKTNNIKLYFYSVKSAFVADAFLPVTHWGTVMKDIATYLIAMSESDRAKLAVTFNGADYYQGYIVAEGYTYVSATVGYERSTYDNLIGTVYLVNLSGGLASAATIPMREYYVGGTDAARLAITNSASGSYEVWTPNALAAAQDLVWGNTPTDATWFAMYPKYYILDATGETYFIIWTNGLSYGATTYYVSFHLYVINGAEDYLSTTINLYELTFLDARSAIPDGLKVSYPYLGLFNLTQPGQNSVPAAVDTDAQFLGWSWQYANSGATSAATNWDVLTEMARDVGTISATAPQPSH